jgi:hypothetical protein
MTKEQWSKKHADFKQVKGIAAGDDHKAYRVLFAPLLLSHLLETFARIVHNRRALRGRLRRFWSG